MLHAPREPALAVSPVVVLLMHRGPLPGEGRLWRATLWVWCMLSFFRLLIIPLVPGYAALSQPRHRLSRERWTVPAWSDASAVTPNVLLLTVDAGRSD